MDLKDHIRSIPDFPKPGILFYDISTLLRHPDAWQVAMGRLASAVRNYQPDLLAGIVLVVVGGSHSRVFTSDAVPEGGSMPIVPTGTIDDAALKAFVESWTGDQERNPRANLGV